MRLILIFKQGLEASFKWWNGTDIFIEEGFGLIGRFFDVIKSDDIRALVDTEESRVLFFDAALTNLSEQKLVIGSNLESIVSIESEDKFSDSLLNFLKY